MTKDVTQAKKVVIIGAGPAGLTAAYELSKHHVPSVVLEKGHIVGGHARTESYKGFHFDIGGHRFFTKIEEVEKIWHEVLQESFLRVPRLSRIFYNNKFFQYPLKLFNTLLGLGIINSMLILLSYFKSQFFPEKLEENFEQWVSNRFGKRLYRIFFKTYTEKVWGIPCTELKAEWAAQRIKDLSLRTAVMNIFFKPKKTIKTLIEQFDYPALGPGMMWNAMKNLIEARNEAVKLQSDVIRIHRTGTHIDSVVVRCGEQEETIAGTHFISSMPITEFIAKLAPPPPEPVLLAAQKLRYRDFLTVGLIVNKRELFPDNWIYIHSPEVQVGRIQNFKNWSAQMVPDPNQTSLGLEYFCTEGDALWTMSDEDLIDLGKLELEHIGLAKQADIENGVVFRQPKAYPIYDTEYQQHLEAIKSYEATLENFQTVGRNGLHRYNNQDHAMLTAMLAVRNLLFGEQHDLWSVNTEQEYHEAVSEPEAAEREAEKALDRLLAHIFPKLDHLAFGLATGVTVGGLLFVITLWLVLRGGDPVGPNLQLLNHYFYGYTVTFMGSFIGMGYGLLVGFIGGWLFALLRNTTLSLYGATIKKRAQRISFQYFLEYVMK